MLNDCLTGISDDQTELQMFPKHLLRVSVRKLNTILIGDTNYGGIQEAMDEENNIIISGPTLRTLLPTQLKEFQNNTTLCVVVNVVFMLKVCINYCYPGVISILKAERSKSKFSKQKVW